MITRCTNLRDKNWRYYGGRGITIDPRWLGEHGFKNLVTDMGERSGQEYELDRIDPDSNYAPGLCQWILKGTGKRRQFTKGRIE